MVQPAPTWELTLGTSTVDVTSDVLNFDVEYGCHYDWDTGSFRLLPATGFIVLSGDSGHYDPDSSDFYGDLTDYDKPVPVTFKLDGTTRWKGTAVASPAQLLSKGAAVTWALQGAWRRYLERNFYYETPVAAADISAAAPALLLAAGLSSYVDESRYPPNVYLQNIGTQGTAARTWNALALASGTIPFENHLGVPNLARVDDMGTVTAAVARQSIEANESIVQRLGVSGARALELSGPYLTSAASATLTTGTAAADDTTNFRRVSRAYLWPSDTVQITWQAVGQENTSVELGSLTVQTINVNGRKYSLLECRARPDSSSEAVNVNFNGAVTSVGGYLTSKIQLADTPTDAEIVRGPPWYKWDQPDQSTASHLAMLAISQSAVWHAQLVVPLWGTSVTIPVAEAVKPGYAADFNAPSSVAGDLVVNMRPVMSMRWLWAAGGTPRCMVTGIVGARVGGTAEGDTPLDVNITPEPAEPPSVPPLPGDRTSWHYLDVDGPLGVTFVDYRPPGTYWTELAVTNPLGICYTPLRDETAVIDDRSFDLDNPLGITYFADRSAGSLVTGRSFDLTDPQGVTYFVERDAHPLVTSRELTITNPLGVCAWATET